MSEHDFGAIMQAFLEDNIIFILIAMAIPIGFLFLFRALRKVPGQPDYIRVFRDEMIIDESMNKPEKKYGVKSLWRGRQVLGKVVTISDKIVNVPKKSELVKVGKMDSKGRPIDVHKEKMRMFTVVFKKPALNLFLFKIFMGKEIIHFSDRDEYTIEDKGRLIFPSDTAFTAIGKVFSTTNSYQQLSVVVLDVWNKNLLQANTNLMSSEMAKISAQTPEMAHNLSLKRLEIDKIRAEKQMKIGQII